MKTIRVQLKERPYNILVGKGLLNSLGQIIKRLKLGESAFVITNPVINLAWGGQLRASLKKAGLETVTKEVPDSEKSKSLRVASGLIREIARESREKQALLIAFGGGVIGDLCGFIASVYRRGLPCVQVPTTLLAQVDSAIGGKNGLDLDQGKNLIGTFYQPALVCSDINLLKTLDQRQIRNGLAEIIKYGLIKDAQLFSYLENNYRRILKLEPAALEKVIIASSAIKAKIVAKDEKEAKGLRTLLNFGHTIGHAIENAFSYRGYGHGEAVALGMLVAAGISEKLSLLDQPSLRKIELLIAGAGLPTKIKKVSLERIISAHYYDKKFIGAKNRMVLLKAIGKAVVKTDVPLAVIKAAVEERF